MLVAHQIKLVAHEAVKRQKMRWLFLTLTIRNCEPEQLQLTIDHMMLAWKNFIKRKELRKIVIGWFRGFEVTRNQHDGTFHPHFHVLLGVPPSYFNGKGNDYLKTSDIALIWKECLKVDYIPIVDIRIVKNKRSFEKEAQLLEEKGIEISSDGRMVEADLCGSAVAEMAKYATKSEDYLIYNGYTYKNVDRKGKMKSVPILDSGINEQKTDETVLLLDRSLSRRRLLAYGGLLKDVWEELQLQGRVQDAEDDQADLIHVDDDSICKCSACGSDMLEELYSWIPGVRQYIKKENHSDPQI